MPEPAVTDLIGHARRRVRVALRQWKATDLARVHKCRGLLEQSVDDLKTAIELLRKTTPRVDGDVSAMIAGLRSDISTMIRLVDACSGFHRRVSLHRSGGTPSYDASGRTIAESDPAVTRGLSG
ncbi:MAG TPA: hypothetical protein VMI94_23905 [Bryobacteraceae bacterium]|nr:hypothetical protein [Bryobacteraceae bacterium]